MLYVVNMSNLGVTTLAQVSAPIAGHGGMLYVADNLGLSSVSGETPAQVIVETGDLALGKPDARKRCLGAFAHLFTPGRFSLTAITRLFGREHSDTYTDFLTDGEEHNIKMGRSLEGIRWRFRLVSNADSWISLMRLQLSILTKTR